MADNLIEKETGKEESQDSDTASSDATKHKETSNIKTENAAGDNDKPKEIKSVTKKVALGKPSDADIDKNLIKKKGFWRSYSASNNPQTLLDTEIEKIEQRYNVTITEYEEMQHLRVLSLEEAVDTNKSSIQEVNTKKLEYEKRIKIDIPIERKIIEGDVRKIELEVFDILKEIGKKKEEIVETAIDKLSKELKKAINLNRELQDEQNKEFLTEFNNDKVADAKKIKFLESILETYQEHYKRVTERLKILSRDGINNQVAGILIVLGTIGALVSGWWFSLWTGSQSSGQNNLPVETSVKLFFLDNVSKFLSYYSLGAILTGLVIYLASVGTLAWVCYILLIKFGFINDNRRKKKSDTGLTGQENGTEISVDLQEDEELLKIKLGGNNWLAVWLKIAPFIFAFVPILAIIAKQVSTESALLGGDKVANFQSLFDSLVNQFIGTCIAFSFATFAILYFSRVTEKKYHKTEAGYNDETTKQGSSDFTFYVGIVFFLFMIITMFIYQKFGIKDIRQVAIIGFLVSCIATGFSLGYGYLFQSMQENAEFLLARIDIISTLINKYSKPLRVNYTSNGQVRDKIYSMQKKMMELIQYRQEMAIAVAGGYNITYKAQEEKTPERNNAIEDDTKQPAAGGKPTTNTKYENTNIGNGFLKNVVDFIKLKWLLDREKKQKEETHNKIAYKMSEVEINYFAEKSQQLGVNNDKLKELKNKLEKLEIEEQDYLRNAGTYRSIIDQIKNLGERTEVINDRIAKIKAELLVEKEKLKHKMEEEKILFEEGFYTGIWLRQSGNSSGFTVINDNLKLN